MQLRAPLAAPRDRKGDRTRERLFQAALAEFRERGFDTASVGAIAQRAGTSRASFYSHYPSKEAVLLDLQWRVEVWVVEQTRDRAGLRAFLTALIDAMCAADTGLAAGGLLRVMLGVYIRHPAGIDLSLQKYPIMTEVVRRFALSRDGELRAGLNPGQAAELFLSGVFGLVAGTPGNVVERRDDLITLATLFLASDADVAR
jgi:TetR/AcrR family transcriptional regulator, repressor for uid operon